MQANLKHMACGNWQLATGKGRQITECTLCIKDTSLLRTLHVAKAEGPGFNSQWLSWVFFFFSSWLTNVDGMKDMWCSSTVRLLSTQI